jgi:hypothetical protein
MADTPRARRFERDGFLPVEGLLRTSEIEEYRALYDRFLSGAVDVGRRRSDLGAGAPSHRPGVENITQVMWPSDTLPVHLVRARVSPAPDAPAPPGRDGRWRPRV